LEIKVRPCRNRTHSGVIHAAPGRQAADPAPERGGHQGLGRPGLPGGDSKHPAGCQHDPAGVLHRRQQVDGAPVAVGCQYSERMVGLVGAMILGRHASSSA
jgi:hypothetical protein